MSKERINNFVFKIGQRVFIGEETRYYTVRAFNESLMICTKKVVLAGEVYCKIIDLKKRLVIKERIVFCKDLDGEKDKDRADNFLDSVELNPSSLEWIETKLYKKRVDYVTTFNVDEEDEFLIT